jgi:hypothetical protein
MIMIMQSFRPQGVGNDLTDDMFVPGLLESDLVTSTP